MDFESDNELSNLTSQRESDLRNHMEINELLVIPYKKSQKIDKVSDKISIKDYSHFDHQIAEIFYSEHHKQLQNCRKLLKLSLKTQNNQKLAPLLQNIEKYEQTLLATISHFNNQKSKFALEIEGQRQINNDLTHLSAKQESLLLRIKEDLSKKNITIQNYEKIIQKNEQNIENQLAQIKNQAQNQELLKDTYEMQIKQLETQIQLVKKQNQLEEEKIEKMKVEAYRQKVESQEEIAKLKVKKPCQECKQLKENLEEMTEQMEKIESKIESKCMKIEQKMQKKIDKYKEQIQILQNQNNEQDNDSDDLAQLEHEINNL